MTVEDSVDRVDQIADVSPMLSSVHDSGVIGCWRISDQREKVVVERQHDPAPFRRVSKLFRIALAEGALFQRGPNRPVSTAESLGDRSPDVLVATASSDGFGIGG